MRVVHDTAPFLIAAELQAVQCPRGLSAVPEHLDAIAGALESLGVAPWILHGRMTKRQRADLIAGIEALPPDAPTILLATGKLVGEGFDHLSLDTLALAMPVSWKGTLRQYAGRLHRDHAGKVAVRILDFVDTGHPALLRTWKKRQQGYRAMGCEVDTDIRPTTESLSAKFA